LSPEVRQTMLPALHLKALRPWRRSVSSTRYSFYPIKSWILSHKVFVGIKWNSMCNVFMARNIQLVNKDYYYCPNHIFFLFFPILMRYGMHTFLKYFWKDWIEPQYTRPRNVDRGV
jgi:hypothetical protein